MTESSNTFDDFEACAVYNKFSVAAKQLASSSINAQLMKNLIKVDSVKINILTCNFFQLVTKISIAIYSLSRNFRKLSLRHCVSTEFFTNTVIFSFTVLFCKNPVKHLSQICHVVNFRSHLLSVKPWSKTMEQDLADPWSKNSIYFEGAIQYLVFLKIIVF